MIEVCNLSVIHKFKFEADLFFGGGLQLEVRLKGLDCHHNLVIMRYHDL